MSSTACSFQTLILSLFLIGTNKKNIQFICPTPGELINADLINKLISKYMFCTFSMWRIWWDSAMKVLVKNHRLGARWPGFKYSLYYLLALWTWSSYATSPHFIFSPGNRIIMIPESQDCCEDKMSKCI